MVLQTDVALPQMLLAPTSNLCGVLSVQRFTSLVEIHAAHTFSVQFRFDQVVSANQAKPVPITRWPHGVTLGPHQIANGAHVVAACSCGVVDGNLQAVTAHIFARQRL